MNLKFLLKNPTFTCLTQESVKITKTKYYYKVETPGGTQTNTRILSKCVVAHFNWIKNWKNTNWANWCNFWVRDTSGSCTHFGQNKTRMTYVFICVFYRSKYLPLNKKTFNATFWCFSVERDMREICAMVFIIPILVAEPRLSRLRRVKQCRKF